MNKSPAKSEVHLVFMNFPQHSIVVSADNCEKGFYSKAVGASNY